MYAQVLAFLAALLLMYAPLAAQSGMDWITGLPRHDIAVASWPGGKKVAVAFVLYVEVWGHGQGPNFRPEQRQGLRGVALLPGGQAEGQRVAKAVAGAVQLAGEAATRAAKRLITLDFFAPAAQAWARTTVLSSITHSRSASAARRSISAAQTPFSCQRANRLSTLSQLPTSSGTSRQAQPARTASTKRRVAGS